MAETLAPAKPEIRSDSTENDEQKLNMLIRTRQAITQELKLTFTLPNPREAGVIGTGKDLFWKAMGIGGVYAGNMIFGQGEHGSILMSPGETQQQFENMRHAVEGVGIGTAAMGALAIFLANRARDKK